MLIQVQQTELQQLLKALVAVHKSNAKEGFISEYTNNSYESAGHFLMNHFAKMFNLILEWESDKPDVILMSKGKGQQDSLMSELLACMQ